LIGQVFVHGNSRFEPTFRRFRCLLRHCFGRTAAFAKAGENTRHVFRLDLQDQRVAGAIGTG